MFSKSTLALSAMLIVSATSAAFAYEEPEHKLGDRYAFLAQMQQPVSTNVVAAQRMTVRTSSLSLYTNEVPEHRIADRYSFLEQPVMFAAVKAKATGTRYAKSFTVAEKSLFDRQTVRFVF